MKLAIGGCSHGCRGLLLATGTGTACTQSAQPPHFTWAKDSCLRLDHEPEIATHTSVNSYQYDGANEKSDLFSPNDDLSTAFCMGCE